MNYCRLCLKSITNGIDTESIPDLPANIQYAFGVKIDPGDPFSKSICHPCFDKSTGLMALKSKITSNQQFIAKNLGLFAVANSAIVPNVIDLTENQQKRKPATNISDQNNNNGQSPLKKRKPENCSHQQQVPKKKTLVYECTFCTKFFLTLECCNQHIQKHRDRGDKGKKCSFCLAFTNHPTKHLLECEAYNKQTQNQTTSLAEIESDAEPEMPKLTAEVRENPRSNLKFFAILPWNNEINQQHVQRIQQRSKSCFVDQSQIRIDDVVENNPKPINNVVPIPRKGQTESNLNATNPETSETVKKGRGRPRTKSMCSSRMEHDNGSEENSLLVPIKRGRGRPRTKSMCATVNQPKEKPKTTPTIRRKQTKSSAVQDEIKVVACCSKSPTKRPWLVQQELAKTTPAARRQRTKSSAYRSRSPPKVPDHVQQEPVKGVPKKRHQRSKSAFEKSSFKFPDLQTTGFVKIFRKISCKSPDIYEIVSARLSNDKPKLVKVNSKHDRLHNEAKVKQLEKDAFQLNNKLTKIMYNMDTGMDLSAAGLDETNWSGEHGELSRFEVLDLLADTSKPTSELEEELADLSESDESISPVRLRDSDYYTALEVMEPTTSSNIFQAKEINLPHTNNQTAPSMPATVSKRRNTAPIYAKQQPRSADILGEIIGEMSSFKPQYYSRVGY